MLTRGLTWKTNYSILVLEYIASFDFTSIRCKPAHAAGEMILAS